MREIRLRAARDRLHGLQVMTFEHLAARLAGGFSRPIDNESLRAAIQQALPETELGELDGIKQLPGMVDAAADTFHKAWRAGLNLAARAGDHPRIQSIARLEEAVLERLRPILLQRHRGQAERALANVDLYLSLARAYPVRGLRAFSEAMAAAWADESRAVEGRPDAQEEAVALYTMHAAKGLEWPIVIPVNTMTRVMAPESALIDRENDRFYCPVFGVRPVGYDDARDAEKAELDRERIRLWYVAATRARELLVIPRLDVDPVGTA
ncbi:3'-5' exonuclease [Tepidicaulis sp. LMO-SS28]|uniref:3'-5' exonuclease n=1 Tax=Tepidicaulis sp. LMO-SS28 TaxID=3447455 RepID=UPI003EE1A05E